MTNSHSRLRTILAALALSGLSCAHAQTSSTSSTTTGFGYQLIDLDPNDGIAPDITFSTRDQSISYLEDGSGNIVDHAIQQPGVTAITRDFGQASTSADGAGWRATASLDEAGSAFRSFSAQNFHEMDFELTPATGVLFRATVALAAEHAGLGTRSEATASMFGYMHHYGDDAWENNHFNDIVAIDSGARTYYLSGYLHSGSTGLQGSFGIGNAAVATFYGIPGPVPEPQTYVLLLAGLSLLRWRARSQHGTPRA